MGILSNKLVIVLIVLIVLVVVVRMFFDWSSRWTLEFEHGTYQLTADLEQQRVQLEEWSDDFLGQFPDVPAVKAIVENYQEILSEVTARHEELNRASLSAWKHKIQLTKFAQKISGPLAERTRFSELHLELMPENNTLKKNIYRYLHTNVMLPVPLYLLGLNQKDLRALQKELATLEHALND